MRGLLIWFSIIVVLAYMVGGIAYYIEKKAIKENKINQKNFKKSIVFNIKL